MKITTISKNDQKEILKVALKDLDESTPRNVVPAELEYCFDPVYISHLIQQNIETIYSTSGTLSITLPGAISVIISSSSSLPYLVPWTISYRLPFMSKPIEFQSYSPELSHRIYELFHDSLTPAVHQLLNPSKSIWQSHFWYKIPDIKDAFSSYYAKNKKQ